MRHQRGKRKFLSNDLRYKLKANQRQNGRQQISDAREVLNMKFLYSRMLNLCNSRSTLVVVMDVETPLKVYSPKASSAFKVIIRNLSDDVSTQDIFELFVHFGVVLDVYKKRPSIGVVIFADYISAAKSYKVYNLRKFDDRPMYLELCELCITSAGYHTKPCRVPAVTWSPPDHMKN